MRKRPLPACVRDTSGAVLPGVTVEAASPALIEKVRSVVTDATGQYRIVNLLPGTYSVTFSLPGFSTVKREGIELTGTFVATVNGDLKVGALEETITVTGETPVVDVQSARVQQTVSKEILAAIPSARTAGGIQALIPGTAKPHRTGADVGGASGSPGGSTGSIHGGRPIDSRSLNDGLSTNHAGGGGGGGNNANTAGAQEIVVSTSGGLGEAETGGVTVNLIPREGGNTFSGTFFVNGANGAMQGSNYTQALKDQGLQGAVGNPEGVRLQSHGRRADHPGQALVLSDGAHLGGRQHGPGHVSSTRTPATRMPGRMTPT